MTIATVHNTDHRAFLGPECSVFRALQEPRHVLESGRRMQSILRKNGNPASSRGEVQGQIAASKKKSCIRSRHDITVNDASSVVIGCWVRVDD